MKFTVLREHFQKVINASQRIVSKNPTLPILEGILIETENKRIKISATNLEIGVYYWVKGRVDKEGSASIPAAALGSLTNTLRDERITIEGKKNDVELSTQTFTALVKGYDYNDFPIIPSLKEGITFEIPAKEIVSALSRLENSATISETYPEISGIFWTFPQKNTLELVATDSFRLGKILLSLPFPEKITGKGFIVPLRSAQELLRIASDYESGNVRVSFNQNQVVFLFDEVYCISRLLSGSYPNYHDLIPKDFVLDVTVAKEELITGIKLVSVFSPKTSDIKLDILGNALKLSAQTQGGSSEAQVKGRVEGSGVSGAMFNYRYLLDGLANIREKEIVLHFKHDSAPVLFQGVGDNAYCYVLMPLKS